MAFPEIYNVYINKPIHGLNIVIITNILESNQTGIHPQKYIGMSLGQQFSSLFFSQTKLCKNQFNVFLPLSLFQLSFLSLSFFFCSLWQRKSNSLRIMRVILLSITEGYKRKQCCDLLCSYLLRISVKEMVEKKGERDIKKKTESHSSSKRITSFV